MLKKFSTINKICVYKNFFRFFCTFQSALSFFLSSRVMNKPFFYQPFYTFVINRSSTQFSPLIYGENLRFFIFFSLFFAKNFKVKNFFPQFHGA